MADAPRVHRIALPATGTFLEVFRARYAGFSFAPHAHAELALGLGLEGRHRLIAGGRAAVVSAGDVVVLPPETIHAVDSLDGDPWSYLMVYVPAEVARASLALRADERLCCARAGHVARDAETAALLRHLTTTLLSSSSNECGAAELTRLHALIRRCVVRVRHGTERPTDATVAALLAALMDPSTPTPRISAVARERGLSVFQLIRRFHATVGSTPIEYRTHIRARWARALLGEARSVGEVAHLVGYADQSHLNRHFKRVFGITPGAYRCAIRRPAALPSRGAAEVD